MLKGVSASALEDRAQSLLYRQERWPFCIFQFLSFLYFSRYFYLLFCSLCRFLKGRNLAKLVAVLLLLLLLLLLVIVVVVVVFYYNYHYSEILYDHFVVT